MSQPLSTSARVRASNPPAPAAGSATKPRLDSRKRTSWPLRARRRARPSGRPTASVCGRTQTLSAPPRPAEKAAIAPRMMFTYGVARGHHPPRALRLDMRLARRKAAGLLDPRPGEAQGAEFRQGDELVRVGREAEGDHAARRVERNAHGFEPAQESDAGGERESRAPGPASRPPHERFARPRRKRVRRSS